VSLNRENVLLLGPPGAGKGTQAKFIEKEFKKTKVDAGNLIREAIKKGNSFGIKAQRYVDNGKLIPDQMILELILENLQKLTESKQSFLLDGFPRNLKQAESLEKLLKQNNLDLDLVLELKVDLSHLSERITNRRICKNKECGALYHLHFSPPQKKDVCDLCGSSLYQRSDDKEELVKVRIKTYFKETLPLSDFYRNKNKLFQIDGNLTPEEVSSKLKKLILFRQNQ